MNIPGAQFCERCGTALLAVTFNQPPPPKPRWPIAIVVVIVVIMVIGSVALSIQLLESMDNSSPGYDLPPYEPPPSDTPDEDDNSVPVEDEKWSTVGVKVQNWNTEVTYTFSIYIDGEFRSTAEIRPSTSLFSSYDVYWTGTYFHNTTVEMRCSAGNQVQYVEVAENTIGAGVTFKIDGPDWDW